MLRIVLPVMENQLKQHQPPRNGRGSETNKRIQPRPDREDIDSAGSILILREPRWVVL